MKSNISGILYFYPDEKNSPIFSTFKLREGENIIGSSSYCDVKVAYPDVSEQHCKITLSGIDEYSIEDLGSKSGVSRLAADSSKQVLKSNKEYELVPKKPFYIANKYKCIFQPSTSQDDDDEDEAQSDARLSQETMNIEDQPTLMLNDDSPPPTYNPESKRKGKSQTKEILNQSKNSRDVDVEPEKQNNKKGKDKIEPKPKGKDVVENRADEEQKISKPSEKASPGFVKNFKGKAKGVVSESVDKKVDINNTSVEQQKQKVSTANDKKTVKSGQEKEGKMEVEEKKPKDKKTNARVRSPSVGEEIEEKKPKDKKVLIRTRSPSLGDDRLEEEEENKASKNKRNIRKRKNSEDEREEKKEEKKEMVTSKSKTVQSRGEKQKKEEKEIPVNDTKGRRKNSLSQSTEPKNVDKNLEDKDKETKTRKGKTRGDKESLKQFEQASTSSKKIKMDTISVDDSTARTKRNLLSPNPPSGRETSNKGSANSKYSIDNSPSEKSKRSTSKKSDKMEEETPKLDGDLPKRNAFQVMFSAIEENDSHVESDKRKLAHLGARIVEDKDKNFTILVMKKFKRRIKFLLALARGIDIVNYSWVTDSIQKGSLQPPAKYLYTDKSAESQYKFKLAQSLEKAKSRTNGLLDEYRVYIAPNIKPSFDEVKLLVESLGGDVVKTKPTVYKDNSLIILNSDDDKNASHFKELSFPCYTTELLFSGILHQKLNFKDNKL